MLFFFPLRKRFRVQPELDKIRNHKRDNCCLLKQEHYPALTFRSLISRRGNLKNGEKEELICDKKYLLRTREKKKGEKKKETERLTASIS